MAADTRTAAKGSPLRVVIAGGGVAALEALLALRRLAEDRVSLELLAPEPRFWYRPLAVVEPFGVGDLHGLELAAVAAECSAAFVLDALAAVDADERVAHTAAGAELEYDALLIATGARPAAAVEGAFTFRGPADTEAFRRLLADLESGSLRRLVFSLPGGVAWPLPLYELALQTAAWLRERDVPGVELHLVTPEEAPLAIFGQSASAAVAALLDQWEIALHTHAYPTVFRNGALALAPTGSIATDCVVALPRLRGLPPEGVPRDADGFLATDGGGRVHGLDGVFAAGDVTSFPVKQGGLAAQQADAAAQTIAAAAGADIEPTPFQPVLRGLLLTGGEPTYVRAELGGGRGETSVATHEALWWPPGKIAGRYLAPFLAERGGLVLTPPERSAVAVDVELPASVAASVR